jgi:cell division protein FtsI/penicillin-binding protein 2
MTMNDESARQTDSRRVTVLALLLTFALAVVVAQLVRYQVFEHAELKVIASEQRQTEKEAMPKRGTIVDAHGRFLALNLSQFDISASPELVIDADEEADILSPMLALDRNTTYGKLSSDAKWVRLAVNVPQHIGEEIAARQLPGIMCEVDLLRTYPSGELAAHVIGFVNQTDNGFYGVEGYYNALLRGITGTIVIEKDGMGDEIAEPPRFLHRPESSTDLILTLDLNIQYIAQQELQRALERYKAESGTVIVMDPRTGALLAVVSLPTYNPNEFATADPELLADPAVSSMWEPGSILKIITWSAGLDSGTITPETTVYDSGEMEVGGRVLENSDRKAHGEVNMSEALGQSLNTVAAYISTNMGKDRFYTYLRRFGFGDLTGVDLDSEGPGMMKLPGDSDWFPSDLGTNSFGQGIAVTPMQMVRAVAAVANDGLLMQPYIVQQLVTEEEEGRGKRVVQIQPKIARQAISRETAQIMTAMLVEAVEKRTSEARIRGYQIAGKTGTAQIPTAIGYDPDDTIVSFVGYAPADDPQFIVLVKLDRPRTSRWADRTAAPAFRAIAEKLLVYMQIPPDEIRLVRH